MEAQRDKECAEAQNCQDRASVEVFVLAQGFEAAVHRHTPEPARMSPVLSRCSMWNAIWGDISTPAPPHDVLESLLQQLEPGGGIIMLWSRPS